MSVIAETEKARVKLTAVGITVNVQLTMDLNELGEMVTFDIHQCAIGAGNSKQLPRNEMEAIGRRQFVEANAPTLIAHMLTALRQTIETRGKEYFEAKEKGKHILDPKLIKG